MVENTSPKIGRARPRRRFWLLILAGLVVGLLSIPIVWSWANSAEPEAAALAALRSDERVRVETGRWTVFYPANTEARAGFIFYPGGLVPPAAYAPPLREIAAAGYLVAIPRMPLNLAFFNPGAAGRIFDRFPEIDTWALGGHSLGGAMAASFTANNPGRVAGLVLWAAYASPEADLSAAALPVVSIYGTRDGLISQGAFERSRGFLPAGTEYVPIDGGNHDQFGYYGRQSGDRPATISREAQLEAAVAGTLALLAEMKESR